MTPIFLPSQVTSLTWYTNPGQVMGGLAQPFTCQVSYITFTSQLSGRGGGTHSRTPKTRTYKDHTHPRSTDVYTYSYSMF